MSDLAPILQAFAARTGITPAALRLGSHDSLMAKLQARVSEAGIDRVVADIRSNSALFDELADELTISETYFFRHDAQFHLIRSQILPEITARCGVGHSIRCWSAGCSSGEEAYSLAIVLSEAGLENNAAVMGTDVSLAALSSARAAKYRAWSLRGEGAASAARYLHSEAKWKVVNAQIRGRVNFLRLNLAEDCYPVPSIGINDFDLILCRNVLIYFDEKTIADIARRLFASLAYGGWLVTAAADPILTEHAAFEVMVTNAGLVYRRPLPSSIPETVPVQEAPNEIKIRVPELESQTDGFSRHSLQAARDAFSKNDYLSTAALTRDQNDQPESCVLYVRALANLGNPEAARRAEQAIERHPLCPELYYLLAQLRLLEDKEGDAILLLRKAIYLAPLLAIAHFMLAMLLRRSGELAGAERHFRTAIELSEAQPQDSPIPMSDGECAGAFAAAARKSLQALISMRTK